MKSMIQKFHVLWVAGVVAALSGCSGAGSSSMNVPTGDYANMTPTDKLFKATAIGDTDTLQTMMSADPALMSARGIDGMTLLHSAAAAGQGKVVLFLLEHGANPSLVDDNNATAREMALAEGQKETAQIISDWVAGGSTTPAQ